MGDADRVRLSFRNGSSSPTGSMTTLGRIEPFDEASTDWNTYAERVEQFFIANAVSEERKTAAFLSIIEMRSTQQRGKVLPLFFCGGVSFTRLDLIRPSVAESVATSQLRQSGRAGREATFADGQQVYARDYQGASKWRRATVVCRTGPVSYKVQVPSGSIWRRHLDQLRPEGSDDFTWVPSQEVDNSEEAGDPAKGESVAQEVSPPERQPPEQDMSDAASSTSAARRYPERVRRPPDRLTVV
ncbi:uncharacterized protein LOC135366772 [Ornithodoros turicata]|uniref:uncharacterized protein LOC135366772 n=1 Tax=Ornithodoros turicata TaxID=34597 RepID=UPI003138A9EA